MDAWIAEALEVAASEAAKAAGARIGGVLVDGSGRLLALLKRAFPVRVDDARMRELIFQRAGDDPEFRAELLDALSEIDAGLRADGARPPEPDFVDQDAPRAEAGEPGLHLIGGDYGAGKTAFVLQVASERRRDYPGGVAYLNTDDFRRDRRLLIGDAQRAVLKQFGVGEFAETAAELHEQYVSVLLRTRCILIVENVAERTEAHALALPLPRSLVLVTTRRLTDDLRAWAPPGPVIALSGVDRAAARRLLAARCAAELLTDEVAVDRLIEACGRVPYYLRLAAARLQKRVGQPGAVARLADDLGSVVGDRLGPSFAELSASARETAVLLASHPGADFTRDSATAMTGRYADDDVDELIEAQLVVAPGTGRYLLFRPARDYAGRVGADREAAFERLLRYYVDRALAADRDEGRLRVYPRPPLADWPDPYLGPIDWLDAEAEAIVALVHEAYGRGHDLEVLQLCGVLEVLFNHRGQGLRVADANEDGIRSAERLGDRPAQSRMLAMQGRIAMLLGDHGRARADLTRAAEVLGDDGDPLQRTSLREFTARLHEEEGDYPAAIALFESCVAADRRINHDVSLGIHLRMLANVLVKAGRPLDALPLLAEASALWATPRNRGRVATVHAKALAAAGVLDNARAECELAEVFFREANATRYADELDEIRADIAARSGDLAEARSLVGDLFERFARDGHPRSAFYATWLSALS